MDLVIGFIPLAILIVAGLLIKLACDWVDRRRFAKLSAKKTDGMTYSSAARSSARREKRNKSGSRRRGKSGSEAVSRFNRTASVDGLADIISSLHGGNGSGSGGGGGLQPVPLPTAQPRAPENVTAVLRRQVPVRDDAPRSWLGGLPMMPEAVEWPRGVNPERPDQGEVPLHFLAQIACEDLPKDLWGGIGPRTGWLLFFINPNHVDASGQDTRRVIHTSELGAERKPPFDCGPVNDRVHGGGSYAWLEAENVPQFWRRWPIDIVSMANQLTVHYDGNYSRKTASPDRLSDILYADMPLTTTESSTPMPRIGPMTFGHARQAVQELSARLGRKMDKPVDDIARKLLLAAEGEAMFIGRLKAICAKISAVDPDERDEHQIRNLASISRALDLFDQLSGEQILAKIDERHEELSKWKEDLVKGCDQIDNMLAQNDPDAPLSDENWRQLTATFAGRHFDHFELRYHDYGDGGLPLLLLRPRETASLEPPIGMGAIAIEYYLDPARRDLLPEGYVASQEPVWRALLMNTPHRMGGYHDPVQSQPNESGFGQLLLLQIASDNAMDWCWGDIGVYYFWIRPEHLEKLDFSGVEVILECH